MRRTGVPGSVCFTAAMASTPSPRAGVDAGALSRRQRWHELGHSGATVWLTGLPAAGKSTIAAGVERRLVSRGRPSVLLDGDILRLGINADLGFSPVDRSENVRRCGHIARLFADAGVVALVALISPYAADRDQVRELHRAAELPFTEVWIATPLEECMRRDPKGLYARALEGSLEGFTGVDAPYEAPRHPEMTIEPGDSVEAAVDRIVAMLVRDAA